MVIVMVLFLFVGLISKKEAHSISNEKENDVRKIAWNYIPKSEIPHIVGSWKDAKVYKRPLRQFNMKQVYIVSFPTNENPSLGDYAIYIDINTKKFLGIGLRD
ncbi:hypothetical protein HPT25_26765 [Bacillus sp. BRMEA1]|nr:hypothetical protein [Neobacillus endophyticus]